jgi:integrase
MQISSGQIMKLSLPGRYRITGPDVPAGLVLKILPSGARHYLLRYQIAGRERWLGLGAARNVSFESVAARARAFRSGLAEGVDPIEAKRTARDHARASAAAAAAQNVSFRKTANDYLAVHGEAWSPKWRLEFSSQMARFAAPIADLPPARIDRALVLSVLEPVWEKKSAGSFRRRLEAVLAFAEQKGLIPPGSPNPAAWRMVKHALPSPSRIATKAHAAMDYKEVPAFMAELRAQSSIAARALAFGVLTAARTQEVLGGRLEEIDMSQKIWAIPGERMKMGKPHRVPLSGATLDLLNALPREAGGFLFPGTRAGRPLNLDALRGILRAMGRNDTTVHGFRSSFRDWAGECTSVAPDIIESALAHQIGNATERSYARSDLLERRRALMEMWAQFVTSPPAAAGENVVPISRRG